MILKITARQMAICVRLALQDGASVDWAKHFSGYVVALLVIFYLQTAGKLPSVLSLQNDPTLEIVKCGGLFSFSFSNLNLFE